MTTRAVHLVVPVVAMLVGILSQYSGFDIWLARHFFDFNTQLWPYRAVWLTQGLIHRGGKNLIVLLEASTLVCFVLTFFVSSWRCWRRAAGYLLLASLSSLLLVAYLKSMTHLYSPWDLSDFGGDKPHIRLFDSVSANAPRGLAFPSGHASGGFALLSVYFLLQHFGQRYRRIALVVALTIGSVFGLGQQVRGAHMLSHDLFAFAICWLVCMFWARIFFGVPFRLPASSAD